MTPQTTQSEEVFVIPREGGDYFLYAPLRRSVAVVNRAAAATVATYLDKGPDALESGARALIQRLTEGGVLGEVAPEHPVFPKDYAFCPHEVTLFPTTRCNLRCRYCYANAGHGALEMSWDVAKSAIDLVAANAGRAGLPKFGMGFHGGGEPTLAWDFIVRCVNYAIGLAEQMGLEADIYTATNGLLRKEQMEFIVRHFTTVNVSLDGPAEIQDYNRPRVGGGGSFASVRKTLRYFDEQRFFYGIRATITALTAPRMVEIVESLLGEFKPTYLHLEPVWECGRCITTGEKPPADKIFRENFIKAADAGRRMGTPVHYSGARLDVLTSKFCAAPGDGFSILPEGIVTSCFEVMDTSDPRAAIFHYGRYDPSPGEIVFDMPQLRTLRQMSVENLPFCRDCFCKWHCAGDCLAKVFLRSGSNQHQGSQRCGLNRSLTLAQLENLISAELSDPNEETNQEKQDE